MARATGTLAVLAPEKGEFIVPHGQAGPAGAWPLPFCQAGVWPTVTRFSRAQTKPKVGLRGSIRTSPGCWELSARGRHSISPAVHRSAPRPLYRGTGSESALLRQNRAAASLFFAPVFPLPFPQCACSGCSPGPQHPQCEPGSCSSHCAPGPGGDSPPPPRSGECAPAGEARLGLRPLLQTLRARAFWDDPLICNSIFWNSSWGPV